MRARELVQLLFRSAPLFIGIVTGISRDQVTVQAKGEKRQAAKPATLILAMGDEVLVVEGSVKGRLRRAAVVQRERETCDA